MRMRRLIISASVFVLVSVALVPTQALSKTGEHKRALYDKASSVDLTRRYPLNADYPLGALPWSVDQLTWAFTDMSDAGGKITIMWDKTVAAVPFKVGS
jgi:hypothetical protein